MGCSDFGVPTLYKIAENFHISAVFTSIPKPYGRGHFNLEKTAIHKTAESLNLPVITVNSMKSSTIFNTINELEADVIVVVAYGFILGSNVLYNKKFGSINLHPSDLPSLRGPAPLQYTILNRLINTKICTIQMDENVDTGQILKSISVDLYKNIRYSELYKICADKGADLMYETLININNIVPILQIGDPSYTKKINKSDGMISAHETIEDIYAKFLAFENWPGIYFLYNGATYKILNLKIDTITQFDQIIMDSSTEESSIEKLQKEFQIDDFTLSKNSLKLRVKNGYLDILEIQPEGKKSMNIKDFLNGHIHIFK